MTGGRLGYGIPTEPHSSRGPTNFARLCLRSISGTASEERESVVQALAVQVFHPPALLLAADEREHGSLRILAINDPRRQVSTSDQSKL